MQVCENVDSGVTIDLVNSNFMARKVQVLLEFLKMKLLIFVEYLSQILQILCFLA